MERLLSTKFVKAATLVAIIAGGLYTLVEVTLKVGEWRQRVNDGIESVEVVKNDLEVVKDDVRRLDLSIKTLAAAVNLLAQATLGTSAGASPRTLSEYGKKISREAGGEELAMALAPELAPLVKDMIPYDIQEMSFNYIFERVHEDADFRRRVRMAAYENGVSELIVIDIISIELREALLETRGN